jgi:hypothetical protein
MMGMVSLVGIYLCLKKESKKADKLLFYLLMIITPMFLLGLFWGFRVVVREGSFWGSLFFNKSSYCPTRSRSSIF